MSHFNYHICMTKHCWRCIVAHFKSLCGQNLLSSTTVTIIIWTDWLPSCLIETVPFGKAEPSTLLEQVTLILLQCIYLGKWYILPAILLFINQYPHATAHSCPIPCLYVTFSVNQHIDPSDNILTHSDLLFLVSLTPFYFHCIDRQQHLFSLIVWPGCWPNQLVDIRCGTRPLLLWAFRIHDAIVLLHISFIVCLPVIFAVIWIIQVTIPVKRILGVGNTFRCTILITLSWMMVDSPDLVDIEYLCSSSRKVLHRQN